MCLNQEVVGDLLDSLYAVLQQLQPALRELRLCDVPEVLGCRLTIYSVQNSPRYSADFFDRSLPITGSCGLLPHSQVLLKTSIPGKVPPTTCGLKCL